nr:lysine-specific demethylase 5A isoform X2 [Ipomoea batatas]
MKILKVRPELFSPNAICGIGISSKLLKISLREQPLIQTLFDKCMKWKQDACSLLNDADCLLNVDVMGDQNFSSLSQKLEHQISLVESAIQAAHYLGFEFDMISKLQGRPSFLVYFPAEVRHLGHCTKVVEAALHSRIQQREQRLWDLEPHVILAEMEASGTSNNMKFVVNGCILIRTLDGANVEKRQEVGEENFNIFRAESS